MEVHSRVSSDSKLPLQQSNVDFSVGEFSANEPLQYLHINFDNYAFLVAGGVSTITSRRCGAVVSKVLDSGDSK